MSEKPEALLKVEIPTPSRSQWVAAKEFAHAVQVLEAAPDKVKQLFWDDLFEFRPGSAHRPYHAKLALKILQMVTPSEQMVVEDSQGASRWMWEALWDDVLGVAPSFQELVRLLVGVVDNEASVGAPLGRDNTMPFSQNLVEDFVQGTLLSEYDSFGWLTALLTKLTPPEEKNEKNWEAIWKPLAALVQGGLPRAIEVIVALLNTMWEGPQDEGKEEQGEASQDEGKEEQGEASQDKGEEEKGEASQDKGEEEKGEASQDKGKEEKWEEVFDSHTVWEVAEACSVQGHKEDACPSLSRLLDRWLLKAVEQPTEADGVVNYKGGTPGQEMPSSRLYLEALGRQIAIYLSRWANRRNDADSQSGASTGRDLQYVGLYTFFAGVQEAGAHDPLPAPILYFPEEAEESKNEQFQAKIVPFEAYTVHDKEPGTSGPDAYRRSLLWGQFNAVTWLPKEVYPFASHSRRAARAREGGDDENFSSLLYLARERATLEWLSDLEKMRVREHASASEQREGIRPVYALLESIRGDNERTMAVGVEHADRFFPLVRLKVARAATPFREGHWHASETYLGESGWGLSKQVRQYFYGEVGPSTHLILLVGPYGTGKTSVAQKLAYHLVEVTPPDWYILAPKPEASTLEFLPVNNYNIFYLFRRAELSRVDLQERLAQLRYYLPPHKNILINFAELNASQPAEVRERLRQMERLLRELREKALPKRLLIFMALNYTGLLQELPGFLQNRPDLVMAGARLSHIWVIQSSHLAFDLSLVQDIIEKIEESKENTTLGALQHLLEKWMGQGRARQGKRVIRGLEESFFLESYIRHRFFGREMLYRHADAPAREWLVQRVVRAVLNRPSKKKAEQEAIGASNRVRLRLWYWKSALFERALRHHGLEPLPSIFQDVLTHGKANSTTASISKKDRNWRAFLETWGVGMPSLAEYLGTDALMRLSIRQGFIRNLHSYLQREFELRHAERKVAHMLASTAGGGPVAKYREILAISAIMEGLLAAEGHASGWPQDTTVEPLAQVIGKGGSQNGITFYLEGSEGEKKEMTFNGMKFGEKKKKKEEQEIAVFFSGQESGPFDGAFLFTVSDQKEEKVSDQEEEKVSDQKEEKVSDQEEEKKILLLLDVKHHKEGVSQCSLDHHKNKMREFLSEEQKFVHYYEKKGKKSKVSLWEVGYKVLPAVVAAVKGKFALILADIAYQDQDVEESNLTPLLARSMAFRIFIQDTSDKTHDMLLQATEFAKIVPPDAFECAECSLTKESNQS